MHRTVMIVLRSKCSLAEIAMLAEALACAEEIAGEHRYDVSTCAAGYTTPRPGDSWIRFGAVYGLRDTPPMVETIVIPDGALISLQDHDLRIIEFLAQRAPQASRIVTLGNGILFATAAGLTRGQTVVADPEIQLRLATLCSQTTVEPQASFSRSGAIWSARGKSVGLAMALAMIEEDLGRSIAAQVALRFGTRLPDGEPRARAKLSPIAGFDAVAPIERVKEWVMANPSSDLSVGRLADMVAMSEKTLSRAFKQKTGQTIGEYVLAVRLGYACDMLLSGERKIKDIARLSGLGSQTNMRQLFTSRYGCSPSTFRDTRRPEGTSEMAAVYS